jgi:CheY-like chemotaxis protein
MLSRLLSGKGELVASLGAACLFRHHDSRGGSPRDHAIAREWFTPFEEEAAWPSAPSPLAVLQPKSSKALHNKVLIADDDALVRGSLAAVLECEGFVADEAENGIEAVSHAVYNFPDLILLDLNMPRMDGWTAFAKLDRVRPLVPVIVITARPHQYKEAVRLGVDAFMEKPLNIPTLVRAIKRLTSEDESRHVRRITNPAFVTKLLDSADS